MRAIRAGVSVVLLGTLCGCFLFFFTTVYSSRSPDGKAEVRVEERCGIADCSVRVVLSRDWPADEVIAWGNDCVITFAHAAWSGTQVAVYIDGSTCLQIRVAHDTATNRHVTFKDTEPWLKTAIIREYAVTPGELETNGIDGLRWLGPSGNDRLRAEFRKRYRQP